MAVDAPYWPTVQLTHTAAPDREYRPTGHTSAVDVVDPAGQKYPAGQDPLHVALVSSEPTVPNVPFGQMVQLDEPLTLYMPDGH